MRTQQLHHSIWMFALTMTAPDVGVEQDLAHLYFVQLVNAVVCSCRRQLAEPIRDIPSLRYKQENLHVSGIAHRDLKPEVSRRTPFFISWATISPSTVSQYSII